jgi:hypothetical protein
MGTLTTEAPLTRASPARPFAFPWVFGASHDLAVSLGGMAAGMGILGLHVFLHINMVLVWFVWVVVLDTPHFFGTYFRTYLDKDEWRARRPMLLGSLGVFLVGPMMLAASYGLHSAGVEGFKLPWKLWGYIVSLWAYFHITRQHYGVLRLYNRKNGEIGTDESRLDAAVLYGVLALAFVGLLFSHPDTRDFLGLKPWEQTAIGWDKIVFYTAEAGVAALVTLLMSFQIIKWMRGQPINLPKQVFLLSVVALHTFVCFSGLLPGYTLLAFTAIVTIYHDIQYLFIVWFYSNRHYRPEPSPRKKFGAAGVLAQSFLLFYGAALLVSAPLWGLGCVINRVALCGPGTDAGAMTFMGDTTWILFFVMLTSGIQMHHYVLDMVIWRPSRSRSVRTGLGLEAAT